jgi:hypothetical protein
VSGNPNTGGAGSQVGQDQSAPTTQAGPGGPTTVPDAGGFKAGESEPAFDLGEDTASDGGPGWILLVAILLAVTAVFLWLVRRQRHRAEDSA